MKSLVSYKFLSKLYWLLNVVYFRREKSSPRNAVCSQISGRNLKILDMCTGTGDSIIDIAQANPECEFTAVDISPEMLEIARRDIRAKKLSNIQTMLCDATDTKLPDESFDIVTISLVLHELPDELAVRILHEAHRLLKPNGRLIVTEWEPPVKLMQKIIFTPIELLEPAPYKTFIKRDMAEYFDEHRFVLNETIPCDYSKVMILSKK